jgi:hypothetical protein
MRSREVGIEFRHPAPGFWRIAFPPIDWTPKNNVPGGPAK